MEITTTEATMQGATYHTVEDGYAWVRAADGRSIGNVSREKHGSGRTSVRWTAKSSWRGVVGYGLTRDEAARKLVAEYEGYKARS